MATLPSPDPDRFGKVHLLRRTRTIDSPKRKIELSSIEEAEARQAEWEKKFEAGDAEPHDYRERAEECEIRLTKELAEKIGTGPALTFAQEAQKMRTFETVARVRIADHLRRENEELRARLGTWRGFAVTLAVLILLMVIASCTGSGRGWLNEYYHEAGGYEPQPGR